MTCNFRQIYAIDEHKIANKKTAYINIHTTTKRTNLTNERNERKKEHKPKQKEIKLRERKKESQINRKRVAFFD